MFESLSCCYTTCEWNVKSYYLLQSLFHKSIIPIHWIKQQKLNTSKNQPSQIDNICFIDTTNNHKNQNLQKQITHTQQNNTPSFLASAGIGMWCFFMIACLDETKVYILL